MTPQYSVSSWLRHWLATYAPLRCSPKTLERYGTLADYLESGPAGLVDAAAADLGSVSHASIEIGLLALAHFGQRVEHLSARTVRHLAGLLSVSLEKAFRLDLVQENPMRKVDLPRLEAKDARSLTLPEILSLRRVCRYDWTSSFVEMALATGARRGELLALEWRDIDAAGRVLSISRSIEETVSGLRVKCTKSRSSRRCTLPQIALAALHFAQPRTNDASPGLLFPASNGDYRVPAYVSQIIVRRLKKAGILDASLHTLRHTHASMLLSRGIPLPTVSARLGHANTGITARIYAHALPPDDARAADEWDALFSRTIEHASISPGDPLSRITASG